MSWEGGAVDRGRLCPGSCSLQAKSWKWIIWASPLVLSTLSQCIYCTDTSWVPVLCLFWDPVSISLSTYFSKWNWDLEVKECVQGFEGKTQKRLQSPPKTCHSPGRAKETGSNLKQNTWTRSVTPPAETVLHQIRGRLGVWRAGWDTTWDISIPFCSLWAWLHLAR